MKTLLIPGAVTAFLGLTVACLVAQTQTTASSSTSYIETSKFIGKKVRSSQGDEIGTVKDIVLDRNTGCLAYTVLSTAAAGGTRAAGGGKMVAVPWAVYSPSSDLNVLTVTVDRDRIYNAPVFDYARVDEYSRPDYVTNVYGYYGVSQGAAAGVGVSSTTTGATTTTGQIGTTGAGTGTAAGAGANANPRGTAPPAPATSPATNRSAAPGPTAALSPHSSPTERPRATTAGARSQATAPPPRKRGPERRGTSEEASPPSGREESGSRPENDRSRNEGSQAEQENAPREARPQTERSRSERANQPQPENATGETRRETEQSRSGESTSGERNPETLRRNKTEKHEGSSPPEQPDR